MCRDYSPKLIELEEAAKILGIKEGSIANLTELQPVGRLSNRRLFKEKDVLLIKERRIRRKRLQDLAAEIRRMNREYDAKLGEYEELDEASA